MSSTMKATSLGEFVVRLIHLSSSSELDLVRKTGVLTHDFLLTSFISIPQAAWPENGAPVPSAPGRAPSHTKHGPPESALICGTDRRGQSPRADTWKAPPEPRPSPPSI